MSVPQTPLPAKLVIGIFTAAPKIIQSVVAEFKSRFGPIDLVSSWMNFDFTHYYDSEMGSPLFRRLFAFRLLIAQDDLPAIKLTTNKIERHCSQKGRRRVNIDPGYLVHERFVLASGKNFSHRIYMGAGIYADLTLIYQKGSFQKLPWTYPDYADQAMICFLDQVRRKFILDLKLKS
jgi:hypothetical protein